tara:strand:- start:104 stop:562 length:459 start_codon:yes stop_codon:yes gene_type:complete
MNFSLGFLSSYNLSQIFTTAGLKSEVSFDDFCLVSNQTITSISVQQESNSIQFNSHISVFNLNEKEIGDLIIFINHITSLKVSFDSFHNPDGSKDVLFFYEHMFFDDCSISPIDILFLHDFFESLVYQASICLREAIISKSFSRRDVDVFKS